jgi:2-dehydro-3-deoxyphosphogluconate aldolase / (4S)-4-hydroxy-2-oxoglutarate aldolase
MKSYEPSQARILCVHGHYPNFIQALKGSFPNVPLIAAGGITQQNASNHIQAGALALGIGRELIPKEAVRSKQADRIGELAHRFAEFVKSGRAHAAARLGRG